MTIGTTRFFQNNSELFSRLNEDLKSLQSQAGSGKADLKLSENFRDVAKLSAADEMRTQTKQFIANSGRVQTDLETLDLAMDRLQNALIRLQEVSVESSNDVLLPEERQRFIAEAKMLKDEIVEIANQSDSFGNSLFGGVSGKHLPFEMSGDGKVSFLGSAMAKQISVSNGLTVMQNFSGADVFLNAKGPNGNFSVFELVDDLVSSLSQDLNSGTSSNLLLNANSVVLEMPDTGSEAELSLTFRTPSGTAEFTSTVYGNDYFALESQINSQTTATGISATYLGGNRISLQSTSDELVVESFTSKGMTDAAPKLKALDPITFAIKETISQIALNNSDISARITDAFEHFATKRAEVSAASRRAQDAEEANMDILVSLEEDIADIEDADLAAILTRIEMLMVQKDAAQATFTRITSKSLFDFLG
jgi:flagellar hook-associated protein 3 FlgL